MLARTASGSVTTSWPATIARPPVGFRTVLRIRSVVVLPAPLGPSSPKIAPGLALERDVRDRVYPAALIVEKAFAEPLNLDHESRPRHELAGELSSRTPAAVASTSRSSTHGGSSSIYS